MRDLVRLQSYDRSKVERSKLISLDLETLEAPTYPILHQEARFLYVLSGAGTIELQGRQYALQPGALLALLPWQISNVTAVEEPLQFYTLIYNLQVFNEFFAVFPESDGKMTSYIDAVAGDPVFYCTASQMAWMQDQFLKLQQEVGLESALHEEQEKPLASLGAMTQLLVLVIHLLRLKFGAEQPETPRSVPGDLQEVLRYMYNHTGDKLSLESLARVFYVSEGSLRNYIKNMTGMSFYDLLNEMRMGKVSGYLLYTGMTLEEISEAVGFWDASHISRVFSEYAGMPVSDYRRTYQKEHTMLHREDAKRGYALSEYIMRHYSEDISPKTVAEEFAVSVSEMNRLLLIQTSRNYEDFLNYIRVSRASSLLLDTQMTVTDISVAVGYASVKTFNRNFFRLFRTTPSNFRRSISLQPGRLRKEDE